MNYYEAKFKREQKPDPTQWCIAIVSPGIYKLRYIGLENRQWQQHKI